MKMLMPSHAKNVRHYQEPMPLFARFQVESYLSSMFNPVVQLKSGGYIVIGITEALVAIDVNSGRATKEGSIEETALKTNLEAADEVARQLRLRDLAGLIVIDFIDMEERKNNAAVEKRFKERLKTDRARIQVGRISGFGLLEMSRQRLRPGMLEATTQPCPACHGTGLIRSDDSLGLSILRQLEEEGVRKRSREVLLKAPVAIINFLMNVKREHIAQIEARYGMAIRLEADPHLIAPDFSIERFKTATRVVPEPTKPVISIDTEMPMDEVEEDLVEDETETEETPETPRSGEEDGDKPKKKRRSRRGGRGRRRTDGDTPDGQGEAETDAETTDEPAAAAAEVPAADPVADAPVAEAPAPEPDPVPEAVEAPVAEPEVVAEAEPEPEAQPQPESEPAPEPVPESAAPAGETSDESSKPKKRGWWSRG
jgi:ribonuclease E